MKLIPNPHHVQETLTIFLLLLGIFASLLLCQEYLECQQSVISSLQNVGAICYIEPQLFMVGNSKQIDIYDTSQQIFYAPIPDYLIGQGILTEIQCAANFNNIIVTGDDLGTINIFNHSKPNGQKLVTSFSGATQQINTVNLFYSGVHFAFGSQDSTFSIYQSDGTPLSTAINVGFPINQIIQLFFNSSQMLIAGNSNTVLIYGITDYTLPFLNQTITVGLAGNQILSCEELNDINYYFIIVCGDSTGNLNIIDYKLQSVVFTVSKSNEPISHIKYLQSFNAATLAYEKHLLVSFVQPSTFTPTQLWTYSRSLNQLVFEKFMANNHQVDLIHGVQFGNFVSISTLAKTFYILPVKENNPIQYSNGQFDGPLVKVIQNGNYIASIGGTTLSVFQKSQQLYLDTLNVDAAALTFIAMQDKYVITGNKQIQIFEINPAFSAIPNTKSCAPAQALAFLSAVIISNRDNIAVTDGNNVYVYQDAFSIPNPCTFLTTLTSINPLTVIEFISNKVDVFLLVAVEQGVSANLIFWDANPSLAYPIAFNYNQITLVQVNFLKYVSTRHILITASSNKIVAWNITLMSQNLAASNIGSATNIAPQTITSIEADHYADIMMVGTLQLKQVIIYGLTDYSQQNTYQFIHYPPTSLAFATISDQEFNSQNITVDFSFFPRQFPNNIAVGFQQQREIKSFSIGVSNYCNILALAIGTIFCSPKGQYATLKKMWIYDVNSKFCVDTCPIGSYYALNNANNFNGYYYTPMNCDAMKCPAGTYYGGLQHTSFGSIQNNICQRCHPDCLICLNQFSTSCVVCSENLYFSQSDSTCSDTCESKQYPQQWILDSTAFNNIYYSFPQIAYNCTSCHNACNDCTGPTARNCTTCPKPFFQEYASSQCLTATQCIELNKQPIPNDDPNLTNQCLNCDSSCRTCNGLLKTDCLSCNANSFLAQESNTCISKCPRKQFKDFIQWKCLNCNPLCQDCFGPSILECTKCVLNYFITDTNECVLEDICPVGSFPNTDALGRNCQQCPTDKCNDNYALTASQIFSVNNSLGLACSPVCYYQVIQLQADIIYNPLIFELHFLETTDLSDQIDQFSNMNITNFTRLAFYNSSNSNDVNASNTINNNNNNQSNYLNNSNPFNLSEQFILNQNYTFSIFKTASQKYLLKIEYLPGTHISDDIALSIQIDYRQFNLANYGTTLYTFTNDTSTANVSLTRFINCPPTFFFSANNLTCLKQQVVQTKLLFSRDIQQIIISFDQNMPQYYYILCQAFFNINYYYVDSKNNNSLIRIYTHNGNDFLLGTDAIEVPKSQSHRFLQYNLVEKYSSQLSSNQTMNNIGNIEISEMHINLNDLRQVDNTYLNSKIQLELINNFGDLNTSLPYAFGFSFLDHTIFPFYQFSQAELTKYKNLQFANFVLIQLMNVLFFVACLGRHKAIAVALYFAFTRMTLFKYSSYLNFPANYVIVSVNRIEGFNIFFGDQTSSIVKYPGFNSQSDEYFGLQLLQISSFFFENISLYFLTVMLVLILAINLMIVQKVFVRQHNKNKNLQIQQQQQQKDQEIIEGGKSPFRFEIEHTNKHKPSEIKLRKGQKDLQSLLYNDNDISNIPYKVVWLIYKQIIWGLPTALFIGYASPIIVYFWIWSKVAHIQSTTYNYDLNNIFACLIILFLIIFLIHAALICKSKTAFDIISIQINPMKSIQKFSSSVEDKIAQLFKRIYFPVSKSAWKLFLNKHKVIFMQYKAKGKYFILVEIFVMILLCSFCTIENQHTSSILLLLLNVVIIIHHWTLIKHKSKFFRIIITLCDIMIFIMNVLFVTSAFTDNIKFFQDPSFMKKLGGGMIAFQFLLYVLCVLSYFAIIWSDLLVLFQIEAKLFGLTEQFYQKQSNKFKSFLLNLMLAQQNQKIVKKEKGNIEFQQIQNSKIQEKNMINAFVPELSNSNSQDSQVNSQRNSLIPKKGDRTKSQQQLTMTKISQQVTKQSVQSFKEPNININSPILEDAEMAYDDNNVNLQKYHENDVLSDVSRVHSQNFDFEQLHLQAQEQEQKQQNQQQQQQQQVQIEEQNQEPEIITCQRGSQMPSQLQVVNAKKQTNNIEEGDMCEEDDNNEEAIKRQDQEEKQGYAGNGGDSKADDQAYNEKMAFLETLIFQTTKSCNINVKANQAVKKTIILGSKEKEEIQIKVYSCDPRYVVVRNPEINDYSPCDISIQLTFLACSGVSTQNYKLFVMKNETPFCKVTLKISYISE